MKENPIANLMSLTKNKKPVIRRLRESIISSRFELSDNIGVPLLEAHLGIRFPFIPKRIVVTGNNVAPHAKRYKNSAGFHDGLVGFLGHYKRDIDGYFIPENSNLFTELHENMHGFIGYINRDFAKEKLSSIEKELTYTFVIEGIAEWAATITSNAIIRERTQSGEDTTDLIKRRSNDFASEQSNGFNAFPDAPTEQVITGLKEDLHKLKTMQIISEDSAFDHNFLYNDISYKAYSVGFYFVTSVMNALLASGMSTNDALIRLISNPPETFDKIFAPKDFAQTLLLAK